MGNQCLHQSEDHRLCCTMTPTTTAVVAVTSLPRPQGGRAASACSGAVRIKCLTHLVSEEPEKATSINTMFFTHFMVRDGLSKPQKARFSDLSIFSHCLFHRDLENHSYQHSDHWARSEGVAR